MTDETAAPSRTLTPAPRPEIPNPWQGTAGGFGFLLLIGGIIALLIPAGVDSQGTIDLAGLFVKDFVGSAAVTLGTVLVGVWILIGAMEWRVNHPVARG